MKHLVRSIRKWPVETVAAAGGGGTVPFYALYFEETFADEAVSPTWNPASYPLTTLIEVIMTGGGGGGAGANGAGTNYCEAGSGGGGGGTVTFFATVGTGEDIPTSVTLDIGAGGAGGSGTANGADGVATWWGNDHYASPGEGGLNTVIASSAANAFASKGGGLGADPGGNIDATKSNGLSDYGKFFAGGQGGRSTLLVFASTIGYAQGGEGGASYWGGGYSNNIAGTGHLAGFGGAGSGGGEFLDGMWGRGGSGAQAGSTGTLSRAGGAGHPGGIRIRHYKTLLAT